MDWADSTRIASTQSPLSPTGFWNLAGPRSGNPVGWNRSDGMAFSSIVYISRLLMVWLPAFLDSLTCECRLCIVG